MQSGWRNGRGAMFAAGLIFLAARGAEEPVLSVRELAALDRENAMWRLVRPDEEISAVVQAWRKAGGTETEVAAWQARLADLWQVKVERNFGWLHEDTVERLKEVDRTFTVRMRAVRLYGATGIRSPAYPADNEATVNRLWRQAILRVLDFDEIAEFRLMNSASAREVGRLVQDLPLSTDEQRTLFQWQREFDATHALPAAAGLARPVWWQEAQLDHWDRIRGLLGDDRLVVCLARAYPEFDGMVRTLGGQTGVTAKMIVDLWWVRRNYEIARSQQASARRMDEMAAAAQGRAAELLGPEVLAWYAGQEGSRWLFPPKIMPERRSPYRPPAAAAAQ